jgi:hypothetical protein
MTSSQDADPGTESEEEKNGGENESEKETGHAPNYCDGHADLAARVDGLESSVKQLIETGGEEADTTPRSVPWTHKRWGGGER